MNQSKPKNRYEKRKHYYAQRLEKQTRLINRISNVRLLTFLAGVGFAVYLYITQSHPLGMVTFLLTGMAFVALVIWHQNVKTRLTYTQTLYEINDHALKRLAGEWKAFSDSGEDFKDADHPYSEDLDLFGTGSLYQWISTAKTFLGRRKLKAALLEPPQARETIRQKQAAIEELATNLAWRQRFLAEANIAKNPMTSPERIIQWGKDYDAFYLQTWVIILARALPIITLTFILLYYLTSLLSFWVPLGAILVQMMILAPGKKQRGKALEAVYNYKNSIKIYEKMLQRFEKRSFQSHYLQTIKKRLIDRDKKSAFEQIRKLSGIADFISNRSNAMFILINILTLWDIQSMIALESWKEQSGRSLSTWLDVIAELEALSSLAVIRFDQPEWGLPEIIEEYPCVAAQNMGHPLLRDSVHNDLSMKKPEGILLITGSNMSGKSTLLRTVGINLVLAYAGAPVCAQAFTCSRMQIYTCMRVSDNLEKNISSFYAELLRIKQIVSAAKTEKQIFFLLDEIFKGTNSQDRHAGAKVLIQQLSNDGAMGMVSTHDLELGELEQESRQKVRNFHFREYYQNDAIHFDYKLRRGISTTRNAMYLIKMAGIDVD